MTSTDTSHDANVRGAFFMVVAMAAFSVEDMLVKAITQTLPIAQILIMLGMLGMLFFMLCATVRKERVFHPAIKERALIFRSTCEIAARLFFTLALATTSLSSTSAILQATPLVVMVGAVFFFNEKVGYRRWLAAIIGFVGVLLIIRPGAESFEPASLFAVLATLGFAGRDLGTRAAPDGLSSVQLGVYGFLMLLIAGLVAWAGNAQWNPLTLMQALHLLLIAVVGVVAYLALTSAMRCGEIALVSPFRYTRLLFALLLGALVFSEVPDFLMLLGCVLIVASGIFSLRRGAKRTPQAETS